MIARWRSMRVLGGLSLAALTLAGCALFGPERPKPQPLAPLTPQNVAALAWSQRVGAVQFPLTLAVARGTVTAAASDGTVVAVDLDSGRELWRASAGAALGAGVGSDGRFAAVVTRSGELVTFEDGRVRWRKPAGTRVSTAPLVAGERIFVLGVDRSVQAFDALDGRKLWTLPRQGDALTLSQTGVLGAYKDTLIVGLGPRLAGLDPLVGQLRWDVPLATPRGANEVERLADLVGPATRVGSVLCARAFQAAVGCVDAERGALAWTRNGGGTDAIAADTEAVYGADASDRISAWRADTGVVSWTSEALLYRDLSAPAVHGGSVVYGDGGGVLHWLARSDGQAQLRLPTDGSALAGPPVVSGSTLLAVTRGGGLFAFRAR